LEYKILDLLGDHCVECGVMLDRMHRNGGKLCDECGWRVFHCEQRKERIYCKECRKWLGYEYPELTEEVYYCETCIGDVDNKVIEEKYGLLEREERDIEEYVDNMVIEEHSGGYIVSETYAESVSRIREGARVGCILSDIGVSILGIVGFIIMIILDKINSYSRGD